MTILINDCDSEAAHPEPRGDKNRRTDAVVTVLGEPAALAAIVIERPGVERDIADAFSRVPSSRSPRELAVGRPLPAHCTPTTAPARSGG
ncbi:hypothetical protein P9209_01060 [Prescottella defluvii]|nr:hypothetical protein P9209_01060 [Prescottella defluvii]